MESQYGTSKHHFNRILDAYLNYVALYKLFNNGKIEGVTPFNIFYWRMTYLVRYEVNDSSGKLS